MNVIELVKELGRAIQEDERYSQLNVARIANDNDEELQRLMGEFNVKKARLNEMISTQSKDKEEMSQISMDLQNIYQALMENESMVAYNEIKKDVDILMSYINRVVVGSLNGEDIEEIPFVEEEEACGGDCSSCGGCH